MPIEYRSKLLQTPEETADFATLLSGRLGPGDTLLLSGEIGAGKTHFCRHLIQNALGYLEDVPSPTFTLVQNYDGPSCEIWHADLYRLTSPEEVIELGLTEAFATEICLVEWPDRLQELAPKNALTLSLQMTDKTGQRRMELAWTDTKWTRKLEDISFD